MDYSIGFSDAKSVLILTVLTKANTTQVLNSWYMQKKSLVPAVAHSAE
jgi:hypothetical protein